MKWISVWFLILVIKISVCYSGPDLNNIHIQQTDYFLCLNIRLVQDSDPHCKGIENLKFFFLHLS